MSGQRQTHGEENRIDGSPAEMFRRLPGVAFPLESDLKTILQLYFAVPTAGDQCQNTAYFSGEALQARLAEIFHRTGQKFAGRSENVLSPQQLRLLQTDG
jgi:hypothetical protein